MPSEKSYGTVIYNKGKYLLLHYQAGHWDFPKGLIEPGETPIKTVRREVEEETGIKDIFAVKGFEEIISYFFKRDGKTVFKEVTFFLFESHARDVVLSEEHKDFAWLPFHEAMNRLTFKNSREVLRKAHNHIDYAIRT